MNEMKVVYFVHKNENEPTVTIEYNPAFKIFQTVDEKCFNGIDLERDGSVRNDVISHMISGLQKMLDHPENIRFVNAPGDGILDLSAEYMSQRSEIARLKQKLASALEKK